MNRQGPAGLEIRGGLGPCFATLKIVQAELRLLFICISGLACGLGARLARAYIKNSVRAGLDFGPGSVLKTESILGFEPGLRNEGRAFTSPARPGVCPGLVRTIKLPTNGW